LLDSFYRFSVNLKGGPAMPLDVYQKWRQKMLIGASLKVVAPTGQYDGTKLINLGNNRWAFKPEIGYSERWGHWVLDGYGAVWFFTTNPEFFSHNQFYPGIQTRSGSPVEAFELHLSYDIKPRLWISLDGNFCYGGGPAERKRESEYGGEKLPGINYGGNYKNVIIAWQYSWIGWPR
jgi:outer membrane putative beta-barrel porin/alpha-amylase